MSVVLSKVTRKAQDAAEGPASAVAFLLVIPEGNLRLLFLLSFRSAAKNPDAPHHATTLQTFLPQTPTLTV